VVTRVGLRSYRIHTAMSDSKTVNSSILEVMICSKNDCVLVQDWSDLTCHMIFVAWWSSINVGTKRTIPWNNSGQVASGRYYLHCGIGDSGSPGIIYIVCHYVLCHPSEHGTSSIGKHSPAKPHIAKLNNIAESEVIELASSMVDETAVAILRRMGSRGITTVS